MVAGPGLWFGKRGLRLQSAASEQDRAQALAEQRRAEMLAYVEASMRAMTTAELHRVKWQAPGSGR
jgi:hypothetical protein